MITIKPLTPALIADYLDFFDNRAFTDRKGAFCYCTYFHYDCSVDEYYKPGREAMRNCAAGYIKNGVLNGYLAYDGKLAVGWGNADRKANYLRVIKDSFLCGSDTEKTKAVVCFEIAPEYRGKGIASAILKRICDDARAGGYTAVEGYPTSRKDHDPFDYAGPVHLYEKTGFAEVAKRAGRIIMRKEI